MRKAKRRSNCCFLLPLRTDSKDALPRDEKAQGSHHKLQHGKFQLDIRKKVFAMRVIIREVPREVVKSPSVKIFKTHLHKALSNPTQL